MPIIVKENKEFNNDYVYDISLDGTVVNALGLNVLSNTDGFNFQMPDNSFFRYTEDNPYIGKGLSRETVEGKEYIGVYGDVAEFNDLFMRGKMGLGIDEFATATINFSRKNYADMFPDGKIKLVGNTIKSKKMPVYIENFINNGINLLLNNKGYDFIESYYNYIDKIYNYQIPLKDIATKGKVKMSISEYKKKMSIKNEKTGRMPSRQAWMELAIQHNLNIELGQTIYYVNTGKVKSTGDVKKLPTGELILNCRYIEPDIIENDKDSFGEYNVAKYIDMFNKRIKPLLVCFNTDIRDKILINDPKDRNYYTENQCILTNGYPYKDGDQDTYDQLLTMEDKEIRFWTSINEIPIFAEELGYDWDNIVAEYNKRQEILKENGIKDEVQKYKEIISSIKQSDVDLMANEGELPSEISKFCTTDGYNIISKKYNINIGTIHDIIDAIISVDESDVTTMDEI